MPVPPSTANPLTPGATRLESGLTIGPGCPPELVAALRAGRPVLLQARYSTSSGSAAYRAAAKNLRVACRHLSLNRVFPDLDELVPDAETLAGALAASPHIEVSREGSGNQFTNRYLSIASPLCPSVWLHLSCGSGRKIDETTMHQPAVRAAAQAVRDTDPAVVCAAEISRWSRDSFALHPWIHEVEEMAVRHRGVCFVSRDGEAPRRWEPSLRYVFFHEAEGAGQEARLLEDRTSRAVRAEFPLQAVVGVARYPISQAPPPPLATAWRRTDPDQVDRGEHIVLVDHPLVRAALGPSVYGLPRVLTGTGEPVDQVALVRFYLRHRGLPDWPAKRLAEYMAAHWFSSEGLRHQRGSLSASWADRPLLRNDRWRLIHSIETHLDFYATGTLTVGVGDGGPTGEIS